MPTELRHLIFKPAEVVDAILKDRRARRLHVPNGTIADLVLLEVEADASLSVQLHIKPDEGPMAKIAVAQPEMITLLIGFCRSRAIPVPMKGTKKLARFGTKLGLVIAIGVE